jgi:putative flippase GtrA
MALMNKNLFFQLCRFGVVGVTAGTVHFSIVVFCVELGSLKPLVANVIAYMIAFQVSYSGHRYWTFRGTLAEHRVAFPKLLLVQTLTFIANESLFYLFMNFFHLPYQVALLIVLTILPITTFALSKFWVFR